MSQTELREIIQTSIADALKNQHGKATFTVQQCSRYSGIGTEKIRELVEKEGTDFPFFKVGVKVVIPKEALDRWLVNVSLENRKL